jgi:hypothetical protein
LGLNLVMSLYISALSCAHSFEYTKLQIFFLIAQ